MITVTNIRNMKPTRYHYAFAIVRSLKICSDANMCHRTIIASILAENGADVRADGVLKRYGMMYVCIY